MYNRLLIVVPKIAVKVLAGVVDAGVFQQRDVGVQSLHWHLQNKREKSQNKENVGGKDLGKTSRLYWYLAASIGTEV